MPSVLSTTGHRGRRSPYYVLFLCSAAIVLDGYDMVVYGTVLPSLLTYKPWALSTQLAGAIASYALFGMLVGALMSGYLTDLIGRRRAIISFAAGFSVLTALCAAAPNATVFGILRLLAGIALGGVLPVAIALAQEYAPPQRKLFFGTVVLMGYPLGAVIVSTLAIVLIPAAGFKIMFVVGGALGLLLIALIALELPESAAFLRAKGRVREAAELAQRYGIHPDEQVPETGRRHLRGPRTPSGSCSPEPTCARRCSFPSSASSPSCSPTA